MCFHKHFFDAGLDEEFARRVYEYIGGVLRRFRSRFHQIYAKAVRYVVTGKLKLLFLNVGSKVLRVLLVVGNKQIVFVVFDGTARYRSAFCSCLDFVFNVGRRSGRRYCAHIVAAFICLEYALSRFLGGLPSTYRCDINVATEKLSWIEAVFICLDMLLGGEFSGEERE